ncbi:MAG TPA: SEL1-like repeat protein [Methylobacter sp.]|jgi:TPR repeat protein
MILLHKPINLIPTAIIVATVLSLLACTEKEAVNNTQTKKAVPTATTVTESKIAQWQKEAKAGDADAQYNLAYLYENGLGVPKDEAKALELYQQAANQGNLVAPKNPGAKSSSK